MEKEDRLQQLKSDLAALDRKILLSLKPIKQGKDEGEIADKQQTAVQLPPVQSVQPEPPHKTLRS